MTGPAADSGSGLYASRPRSEHDAPHETPSPTQEPSPNPGGPNTSELYAVHVDSPTDVWAAGDYSDGTTLHTLIEHSDGTSWSHVASPDVGTQSNYLDGVSAVSGSDAWTVGAFLAGSGFRPLVEHWDGSAWRAVSSPNGSGAIASYLFGDSADSASDGWAVGDFLNANDVSRTLVEHWDGSVWQRVSSPNIGGHACSLATVTALSPTDIWASGADSTTGKTLIEHSHGSHWSVVPSPSPGGTHGSALGGMSAVSAKGIWAVGSYGTASRGRAPLHLHWNGTSWKQR